MRLIPTSITMAFVIGNTAETPRQARLSRAFR
jgi:hypothetical protein